jgi:hypothetical protein
MAAAICGGRGRKFGKVAMAVRLRTPRRVGVEHGYLIAVELPLWPTKVTRKKKKLHCWEALRSAKLTLIER